MLTATLTGWGIAFLGIVLMTFGAGSFALAGRCNAAENSIAIGACIGIAGGLVAVACQMAMLAIH